MQLFISIYRSFSVYENPKSVYTAKADAKWRESQDQDVVMWDPSCIKEYIVPR